MRTLRLKHEFVDFIPDNLAEGVVYISIQYAIVAHRCCCGCRTEVVTPLGPNDWRVTFDGKTITLEPSIGNWGYPCRSHYWIVQNEVIPAQRLSKKQIALLRSLEDSKRAYVSHGKAVDKTKGRLREVLRILLCGLKISLFGRR